MDIRRASLPEISMMLDWAAEEGWNPGLEDAAAFQAADPEGFFIGLIGEHRVAAISVVNHSDSYAFLGLYIVLPPFRGQGYGKSIWDSAITHAEGWTIGLDGVPAQQENYKRSGFVSAGGTARFTGEAAGRLSTRVRLADPYEAAALITEEGRKSGFAKPRYLAAWYTPAPSRRTYVLAEDSAIAAHATLRACRGGYKIGPLCAATADAAETMLDHCLALADGPVSIDVPQSAIALADNCRTRGLAVGFQTARMYRGTAPGTQYDHASVATLELG